MKWYDRIGWLVAGFLSALWMIIILTILVTVLEPERDQLRQQCGQEQK